MGAAYLAENLEGLRKGSLDRKDGYGSQKSCKQITHNENTAKQSFSSLSSDLNLLAGCRFEYMYGPCGNYVMYRLEWNGTRPGGGNRKVTQFINAKFSKMRSVQASCHFSDMLRFQRFKVSKTSKFQTFKNLNAAMSEFAKLHISKLSNR